MVKRFSGWLLLLPAVAFLAVFFAYPISGVARRSFDPQGRLAWFSANLTLANYADIVKDPAYRIILFKTLTVAAEAVVIAVLLAYPVAFFLSRLPSRLGRPLLLLALFPFWTGILIRLYAFTQVLDWVHLLYTTAGTVIGMVHYLLPYMIIVLYASMTTIDSELMTAARSLGASQAKALRYIYFPLTLPGLYAGSLFVFALGLGFYLTPAVLGAASDVTVAVYIQQEVNLLQWGVASSMGMLLLLVTLGIFLLADRYLQLDQLVGVGGSGQKGSAASGEPKLSLWHVGLIVYTGLVFAFLLVPLVVVVLVSLTPGTFLTWPPTGISLRWYEDLVSDPIWLEAAWFSLRIAALTVIAATALGLAAAYSLERHFLKERRLWRIYFLSPVVVPVILTAVSVFELENRLQWAGSLLGLVIGHTVLALPFTVVVLSTALHNFNPNLEEASRTLGATQRSTFLVVTLPLIAPSLVAAAIFAFVTSWDEAVVALFLSDIHPTLPVHIFQFLKSELRPTIAAVSTLLMVGILLLWCVSLVLSHAHQRLRERDSRTADSVIPQHGGS